MSNSLKKIFFACFLMGVMANCCADNDFFYVNILPGSQAKPHISYTTVIINYEICDFKDNKAVKCRKSHSSVGGPVGQGYGIVETLQPNQRVSALEADFFPAGQTYPLYKQGFPMLEDGTTSCTNNPNKNYINFYVYESEIVCSP